MATQLNEGESKRVIYTAIGCIISELPLTAQAGLKVR